MQRRKYTILVIPNGKGESYRFSVDSVILTSLAAFSIIFAAFTFFFSYDYFFEQFDRSKLADLQSEKELLSNKVVGMNSTIVDLQDSYENIVDKEKAIRAIFDLPDIDAQERQLGIGGPELFDYTDKSDAEMLAYQTESEIDELVRLSTFETQQFKAIYEKLLNKKDDLDHMPSIMPCAGYLTRGYGIKKHPISGFKSLHAGIDIANRTGTPIYATASGVVTSVGNKGRLGKTVVIDHGNGIKTKYGHLNKYTIKRGTRVERGDKIGEMGSTGYSTGTHLHYEVQLNGQAVNPKKFVLSPEMVNEHSSVY